jgi:hypothetical protein
LPHRERKKANHQVKLGRFNSTVIGTWDLTEIVAYGGMDKTAGADPNPAKVEERAQDVALRVEGSSWWQRGKTGAVG